MPTSKLEKENNVHDCSRSKDNNKNNNNNNKNNDGNKLSCDTVVKKANAPLHKNLDVCLTFLGSLESRAIKVKLPDRLLLAAEDDTSRHLDDTFIQALRQYMAEHLPKSYNRVVARTVLALFDVGARVVPEGYFYRFESKVDFQKFVEKHCYQDKKLSELTLSFIYRSSGCWKRDNAAENKGTAVENNDEHDFCRLYKDESITEQIRDIFAKLEDSKDVRYITQLVRLFSLLSVSFRGDSCFSSLEARAFPLTLILSVRRNEMDQTLYRDACLVLAYLGRWESFRSQILELGGVKIMLATANVHHGRLCELVNRFVNGLVWDWCHQRVKKDAYPTLHESCALDFVMKGAIEHQKDPHVTRAAFAAMNALRSADNLGLSESDASPRVVPAHFLQFSLLQLQRFRDDPWFQLPCLGFLYQEGTHHEEALTTMRENSGPHVILRSMKELSEHVFVQTCGIRILRLFWKTCPGIRETSF